MGAIGPDAASLVVRGCDVLVRPGDLRRTVDLELRDGAVARIDPAGTRPPPPGVRLLDGRGLLAIPGLVNAHTHSPENCLRGVGEGLALEPWLMTMFGVGGRYGAEEHAVTVLAGAAEMLRSGVTAVVDHLWMTPPTPATIDAALGAYATSGMRAAVAPLMEDADVTDQLAARHGIDVGAGLVTALPEALGTDELLAVLEHAFARWHGTADGRLRILAGPGGVQWATDALLHGSAALAERYGSGVHVHLLETRIQAAACRARHAMSSVRSSDATATPPLQVGGPVDGG